MSETKSEYERAVANAEDVASAYGEHMAEVKGELDHERGYCPTCEELDHASTQAEGLVDRLRPIRVCPNCGGDQYDCRSTGC